MAFISAISLRSSLNNRTSPLRNVTRRQVPNLFGTRMIATEPVLEEATKTELSDRAITLISYIRGHKSVFQPGRGFTAASTTLFKKNDTARQFTSMEELVTNDYTLPGGQIAAIMVDQKDDLLLTAMDAAESVMPSAKTDETIIDILHYDISALLRAISYGAACQSLDFLHENNVNMMKALHDEAGIPSIVVPTAINAVKDVVLEQVSDRIVAETTAVCFDVVSQVFV